MPENSYGSRRGGEERRSDEVSASTHSCGEGVEDEKNQYQGVQTLSGIEEHNPCRNRVCMGSRRRLL